MPPRKCFLYAFKIPESLTDRQAEMRHRANLKGCGQLSMLEIRAETGSGSHPSGTGVRERRQRRMAEDEAGW